MQLHILKLHAVGVHEVVGFLDARDICWVKEEITEIVEKTVLIIVHLSQVLLTLGETRLCESTHHCQQEDTNIVECDMISYFSSEVLPYPHDYIVP